MLDLFTRADYDRLPEGYPAQLVEGWLVKEPAPTYGHQLVQSRLYAALVHLLDPGLVLAAPTDVALGEHDVYQPDLVVLREAPDRSARDVGVPLVAIGILSPSTADRDRNVKTAHLIDAGVEEVWLVDPTDETVEIHTRHGVRKGAEDAALASRAIPGFSVLPRALFA